MRTRIASSVRRDEGGAPPMFSASRTPRAAIALSDITNNLVDTKPDLSASKKKVPAGAHQRAPSNKAKPSKAAAATASDAKPVKPVEPVKLLKLEKPEKSSGVDAVAEDDDSLHASTHSSDGDLHEAGHRLDALTTSDNESEEDKSPLGSDSGGPETESDHLQRPLKKASSKRQRNDTPDDLSDCSEDNLPLTEALSIFSTALATARSDLHKLIGRVQRKEVDMLRAMQSWYKDNPTTYTDEHLAWWSVLVSHRIAELRSSLRAYTSRASIDPQRLVEQTDVERGFADSKREFWLHLSGFATTLATTLAKKAAQRFYHARYCPNGAFDYSIFLYRTVVSQFYDADTSPMTTRPKVSTMDSTFQAQCTTVITTCQPVADFQRLVLCKETGRESLQMTARQWQNWMVEGTTLRCGRHAKPVVWEAESHVPRCFDGKWNLDEGRRSGLADAETALAN
ncbi:BQ5605_C006g03753 [Microbotryum silenes-dioicae]|uniref:BQ5605_C006g03753 protein n=2 Tax=Microbotryum silenes-dioicae TaxID=796604 RepID=A0A2X0M8V0_9BASI|nr:BQ5605_C006g03753 [Microbotryum silenes-dioicae]